MKKIFKGAWIKIIAVMILFPDVVFSQPQYFVCGPDEDGCAAYDYQYCMCMPVDEKTDSPYCLDFDSVRCVPLAQKPDCTDVFRNQSECVATAFQSEAYPPCPVQNKTFCASHHIPICAKDGAANTCIDQPVKNQ